MTIRNDFMVRSTIFFSGIATCTTCPRITFLINCLFDQIISLAFTCAGLLPKDRPRVTVRDVKKRESERRSKRYNGDSDAEFSDIALGNNSRLNGKDRRLEFVQIEKQKQKIDQAYIANKLWLKTFYICRKRRIVHTATLSPPMILSVKAPKRLVLRYLCPKQRTSQVQLKFPFEIMVILA